MGRFRGFLRPGLQSQTYVVSEVYTTMNTLDFFLQESMIESPVIASSYLPPSPASVTSTALSDDLSVTGASDDSGSSSQTYLAGLWHPRYRVRDPY
jgi:hypothetical protein